MRNIKQFNKKLKDLNYENEMIDLSMEINQYKLKQCLGVYHDEDEQKEQRRRIWKLNILKHKEDEEFLKKLGLIKR